MKNSLFSLTVALPMLLLACSGDDGGNPTPSSSSGGNGGFPIGEGQVYDNGGAGNPYMGSGKIYLADKRDNSNGEPILTAETMVEAGAVSNGKVSLALPTSIDSRFLRKINSAPEGLSVEPLGVEMWLYVDPFRLLNNGKHIGNLEYKKNDDGIYHKVVHLYFSESGRINGSANEGGGIQEYKVNAKNGWNEVYMKMNTNDESFYFTTDLSEVPDGLAWILREID